MSHDQESTVAVPVVTINDFASAWGNQEAPGDYLLATGKTKRLLEEIHHAVLKGEVKIFDPFLGCERLFRESESDMHALARGYTRVLPSSINDWLRSIGMATMPAADQPARADAEPVTAGAPLSRQRHQENEMLRVLADLGYDPKQLPRPPAGAAGPKSEARAKLPEMSNKVFDKAWERLRSSGDIADAE